VALPLPERPPMGLHALAHNRPSVEALPVAVRRQNWLLYIFLFFLPLQNIQTAYLPNLGGGLNFLNIGFGLALLGAMRCRGTVTHWSSLHKWIVAYVIAGYISLLVGYSILQVEPDERFNAFKDSMIAVMLVFVTQMSVTDWTTLKRVILATVLPIPYILHVTWSEHAGVTSWHYKDSLRIQGTFSLLGANEFAAFCAMMAVLLLALLIAARLSWYWKGILLAGIAAMAMCVVWTYSRTAYIAIILGGLCVVLLWQGRWKMILPLALVALLLPTVLPESVTERFQSTTLEEGKRDPSTEMRFEFWNIAWQHFTERPLLGIGYRSFSNPEFNPYGMDTHNFFMRELTEKGLFGFTITVGLFFGILRAGWRVMRQSPPGSLAYALGLGMVAAWPVLVVGNCWGDRFTYYPLIGYFWVYLALTMKAFEFVLVNKAVPEKPAEPEMKQPERRFAQPRGASRE
jgi:putative inorganic carbon (HCO3(-)) transporter